jgi:hypothetical protein
MRVKLEEANEKLSERQNYIRNSKKQLKILVSNSSSSSSSSDVDDDNVLKLF